MVTALKFVPFMALGNVNIYLDPKGSQSKFHGRVSCKRKTVVFFTWAMLATSRQVILSRTILYFARDKFQSAVQVKVLVRQKSSILLRLENLYLSKKWHPLPQRNRSTHSNVFGENEMGLVEASD